MGHASKRDSLLICLDDAATLGGVLGRAKRQSRATHYVGGEEVEGVVEEVEGFGGQEDNLGMEAVVGGIHGTRVFIVCVQR